MNDSLKTVQAPNESGPCGEQALPGMIAARAVRVATEVAAPDSGAHTAVVVGEIIAEAGSYEEASRAMDAAYTQEELNLGVLRRMRRQMLIQSLHRSKQITDADFIRLSRGLEASREAVEKLDKLHAARGRRRGAARI